MKLLILTGIAVMCFAGLARADAYDDRKQRQREDERPYKKRQYETPSRHAEKETKGSCA
jgi:hypothetical protein